MRRTCKDVKSLFWDKDSGADISISRDSFEPQRSSSLLRLLGAMGLAEPFKHKQSMCVEQRIIVLFCYSSAIQHPCELDWGSMRHEINCPDGI